MEFVKGYWIKLCVWIFYLIVVRKVMRPVDAKGDIWVVIVAFAAMLISSNLFNRLIPKGQSDNDVPPPGEYFESPP